MAESFIHMEYVRIISDYVNLLIEEGDRCFVLVDLPESSNRPVATIGNFIPDLYYKNNCLIIGEAKTENDFDRKHSIEQYISYIKEASIYNGISHIVICTSIYSFAGLKNLIRKLKRENNSNAIFHILNDNGRIDKI